MISLVVEGEATIYYWANGEFVEIIGGAYQGNYTYYFANGERVAWKGPDGSMHYIHGDHLGSTVMVTDENGNVEEETTYYPYGGIRSGGNETRYLYTGQEYLRELDLYDYGARQYDPGLMHFIQADPVIQDPYDPQTLNRYSYVRNNPLKYTDPTGNLYEAGLFISLLNIFSGVAEAGAGLILLGVGTVETVSAAFLDDTGNPGPGVAAIGGILVADGLVTSTAGLCTFVISLFVEEDTESSKALSRGMVVTSHPAFQALALSLANAAGLSAEESLEVSDKLSSAVDILLAGLKGLLKGAANQEILERMLEEAGNEELEEIIQNNDNLVDTNFFDSNSKSDINTDSTEDEKDNAKKDDV